MIPLSPTFSCSMSCSKFNHIVFFFFSSRRRHTRFDCDWSSDVCSSDLAVAGLEHENLAVLNGELEVLHVLEVFLQSLADVLEFLVGSGLFPGEFLHRLGRANAGHDVRSEEHTSELQSQSNLVCRLLLEKKKT